MTAYGQPPAGYQTPGSPASPTQRATLLAYIAAGLGVLSFIWGFLTWFTEGEGDGKTSYHGYALATQGSALVGLSLAAGLVALALVLDKRGPSAVPAAIAAAGVLVAVGQIAGHGMIGVPSGSDGAHVGIGIGLILGLITVVVQLAALVLAWMMGTGRMPAPRQRQPQYPQYGQQAYPGQQGPGGYYPQQQPVEPSQHAHHEGPPAQAPYPQKPHAGHSEPQQPYHPPAQGEAPQPPAPYQQQPPQPGQYPPPTA